MAGTGSHTVVAKDVFVPGYRAVPLPDLVEGRGAANRHTARNPYFNLPLAPVLIVNGGGTPLGTARGAYETFMERLPGPADRVHELHQPRRGGGDAPAGRRGVAAHRLVRRARAAGLRAARRARARRACRCSTACGRARTSRIATGLARQAVDILFNASGASSIQPHIPIQRFQRDIQALANHAVMHTQTGTELYGRVLCGLEPNTPLY